MLVVDPSDESLGYCRTSLRDLGMAGELAFGSWVVLKPERINAYAQAVIRTLQADEHQCGCLREEPREVRSPKSEGQARR